MRVQLCKVQFSRKRGKCFCRMLIQLYRIITKELWPGDIKKMIHSAAVVCAIRFTSATRSRAAAERKGIYTPHRRRSRKKGMFMQVATTVASPPFSSRATREPRNRGRFLSRLQNELIIPRSSRELELSSRIPAAMYIDALSCDTVSRFSCVHDTGFR